MRVPLAGALRTCVLSLFLSASCAAVAAEPARPQREVTLAEAIESALQRNPELLASRYELTAAQARIVQARLRPNPELTFELENFAGSGAAQGADALETTLSLSQTIELGGKRAQRRFVAEADRDLIAVDQRARQLDVLAQVTRRFLGVVATQERLRLAAETSQLARQTLETVTARMQAARSPIAEQSRARIAMTRAIIDQRQAEAALRSARASLAAVWGSPEPDFSSVLADLFALEPVQSFEALAAQIERNPDLTRFASEARLRDAELRLAQAQARPNLSIGAGLRQLSSTDDKAVVAAFSVPLPAYDRNQGAIREAKARQAQSAAELKAAQVRLRAMLYSLYQEMSAARTRLESLRNEAIPQATAALEQTQSGYERGRFSFLELLTAQQDLITLRAATIDAAVDYHQFLAEIERLTSAPLVTGDAEASVP